MTVLYAVAAVVDRTLVLEVLASAVETTVLERHVLESRSEL